MTLKPWTSGPKELLNHAIEHLSGGGAFDYRIAMISIDNAIELSIKTYLGLPKRVRGCDGPSRQQLQQAGTNFPSLLDLLEEYGEELKDELFDELGKIRSFYRIIVNGRNINLLDGFQTKLKDDDMFVLMPAIAGG